MQSKIFIALCLTPGLQVRTLDHEFRLMCRVALDGKEGDIPLETRPALFVPCDTSNIMVDRMGTMISNSVRTPVGQR